MSGGTLSNQMAWRARLRELVVYVGRRKQKPKEPDGVTVHIYSIHSIRSLRRPAKNTDKFDVLLGILLIGMLVAGGTLWNSRVGKLTGPTRGFWFRETARDTAPAHGAITEAKPDPDRPPSVTRVVPASYTEEARNAGFHGRVSVTVYVNALGVPEDIEATSPIPFDLERTIRPAVVQWRFRPALSHGVAVAGKTMVEVPFR
jgi:TonB family protein